MVFVFNLHFQAHSINLGATAILLNKNELSIEIVTKSRIRKKNTKIATEISKIETPKNF